MSKLPVNPLQGLIHRAAQTLPATTGKVAVQQERLDRRHGQMVLLVDVSASMGSAAEDGRRKIDVLRDAIVAATQAKPARLFAFSKVAYETPLLPYEPEHNTNLAGALLQVQALDPGITLVISDGLPDNEKAALDVARSYRGAIDALYIGPASNTAAIRFMYELARAGGGDMRQHDISKLCNVRPLISCIAGLLR